MYTTAWCGYCRRLKSQLAREGIEVTEVDIERDPAAADYVMSVNGGSPTVPTVVLPGGKALANPSVAQIPTHLRGLTTGGWRASATRRCTPGTRGDGAASSPGLTTQPGAPAATAVLGPRAAPMPARAVAAPERRACWTRDRTARSGATVTAAGIRRRRRPPGDSGRP